MPKTTLKVDNSFEGETIEAKVRRIMTTNEPITDGAELHYTERKDGRRPEFDIRTDRFEHAIDAMDRVSKGKLAAREERLKVVKGGDNSNAGENSDTSSGATT